MKNKIKKFKYPTGGNITPIEKVVPGSERYKQLLELERQKQLYLQNQSELSKYGTQSSAYSVEEFKKKFPDADLSSLPQGANTVYGYDPGKISPTELGTPLYAQAPIASNNQAFNYYAGYNDPGEIPQYSLSEEEDFTNTIQPEKEFGVIKGLVKEEGSGNEVYKPIATSYGYKGRSDTNTYRTDDSYKYYLNKDSNSSFVPTPLIGSRDIVTAGMPDPNVTTFAAPELKFGFGGGVGSTNVGGGLSGNTNLNSLTSPQSSTPQMPNMSAMGYIGMFQQLGQMGEQGVAAIDPDKERGQFMGEGIFNPALSHYKVGMSKDATNAEKAASLLTVGIPGVSGAINNRISNRVASQDANKNYLNRSEATTFAYGGQVEQFNDGTQFNQYSGPTHAQGGIDVDPNSGTPVMNSSTEVEGGETSFNNNIDTYVFSDRILAEPSDTKGKTLNKTFAEISKKIRNKYKNADKDKISKESLTRELEMLKQQQESTKQSISSTSPQQMAWGGKMKYPMGGFPDANYIDLMNKSTVNPLYNSSSQISNPFTQSQNNNFISIDPNDLTRQQPDFSNTIIPEQTPVTISQYEASKNPITNGLPQDKVSPYGYIASLAGDAFDLGMSAKKSVPNDFGKVNFENVNYKSEREEQRKQAGLTQALISEGQRGTSSGAGRTNRIIGNALVNQNLGSALAQSYMNEANQNVSINNQAEQINRELDYQGKLADLQDKALRQSVASKAVHSIGEKTQGYMKDQRLADVGNINNKMLFDLVKEGKYTQYVPTADGKFEQAIKFGDKLVVKRGTGWYDVTTNELIKEE